MKLAVRGLTKVYRSGRAALPALGPLSFAVADGELVSVLGPSGCGKSSALHIVAGLEAPSAGEVLLDGRPVHGPGLDRGMVFQNYTLFPWLDVRDNVLFCQRLRANRSDRAAAAARAQHADHLIELMGLGDFAHARPRELSGGMKQRVAIARALCNRPAVLLLDEPFGALDAQTREEMQSLLLRLARHQATTILFVTHDIEEAAFLSHRVLVLSARPGRVLAEVEVPLPAGDRPLELKLTPEFLACKRHLQGLLQQQRPITSKGEPSHDPADGRVYP